MRDSRMQVSKSPPTNLRVMSISMIRGMQEEPEEYSMTRSHG